MQEHQVDIMDQQVEEVESLSEASAPVRGRPLIPERWTRVISLNDSEKQAIKTHKLADDL